MKKFLTTLESISPYSQSRHHAIEKDPKETHEDYEKRTWRNKVNENEDGFIVIPSMAFKNCLSEAAKFISQQIPGKGKSTYTKHFEAGILVTDSLVLPVKKNDVAGEWHHVPSDGMRGGSKRVMKCFPVIPTWKGDVLFYILDETITLEVFEHHLKEAGNFIGIGRFRPRKNGFYGRFKILSIKEV